MKKSILFLLCVSVLLYVAVLPVFAEEKGLVQCGLLGQASFCDTCDIFVLVQTVLNKLWNPFAIVIAAAMILYGGFLMLLPSLGGGSAAMHTKGVKVLTNALIGLTIVFFAWIGVDTILKVVAGGVNNLADPTPAKIFPGKTDFGPWNDIKCKHAPVYAPIALLQIPEEYQCKPGKPIIIEGFDQCDPTVLKHLQDYWINGQATSFAGSPADGKCKTGMLKTYAGAITAAANQHNVPLNCAQALFITESAGQTNAMSNKGAAGLGQIMPATAKDLNKAKFGSLSPQQIQAVLKNDPTLNINLSMQYFGNILKKTVAGGNCSLAAAGYNAGPDRLKPPKPGDACKKPQAWQCIPETANKMVPGIEGNLTQINGGCNPF